MTALINLQKETIQVCWIFFLNLYFLTSVGCLQCLSEDGEPVDWFVIYKLPKLKHGNILMKNGSAYMYITSSTVEKGWSMSQVSITSNRSIPGVTLKHFYDNVTNLTSNILWMLYNDEPPEDSTSFELGHTKGALVADSESGFWLIHSVPKFPTSPGDHRGYSYPETGLVYGQSFLCITLKTQHLNIVGKQLQFNEPDMYSINIPSSMNESVPNLVAVSHKEWIHEAPWSNKVQINTVSGESFISFAKSSHFEKDLYADFVAEMLNTGLYVETWPNGAGRLASDCHKLYSVKNIAAITCDIGSDNISFKSTKDHSKWAISTNESKPWSCIGDINRMVSQEKRGGGTVCINSLPLWSAYNETINTVEACPRNIELGHTSTSHVFGNKLNYILTVIFWCIKNVVFQH